MKKHIGIAGLLVCSQAFATSYDDSRVPKTQQDLAILSQAVQAAERDLGRIPAPQEWPTVLLASPGMASGWNGPYLPTARMKPDPWNREYRYLRRQPGAPAFGIYSTGANGIDERGQGDDISTWLGYDPRRYSNQSPRIVAIILVAMLAVGAMIRFSRRGRHPDAATHEKRDS